ncbi:SagB/ThcOx family dehydrogenase [Streptomyces sp. NPDC048282]|uniref:SagB/ThcOx family dehydrogenase n=1 Tax=Streptomyces sp. NPDC048282 TaxID=3365528 RepID=UPI003718C1AC
MTVRLNPAVRITPPSAVTGDHWLVEHLLRRRRYRMSRPAVAALIAAARPAEPQELAELLAGSKAMPRPVDHWLELIGTLRERELLVDTEQAAADPELDWLVSVRRDWSRHGWHEAVEYHTLCFDYPCVDYSEALGILADRDRMRDYQSYEPDTDRYKLDYTDRPGVGLPGLTADLIPATAHDIWAGRTGAAPVDREALEKVVAAAFGMTGRIIPRTESAPLLRRSSPSGGGRHPSEAYVVVRDIAGLEPGWYHVTMLPFSLRSVEGPSVDDASLSRLFPNTLGRFPLHAKALVVLTTVFERNMYRYREPRTYRTVHMDAGHLAATTRIAARSLGLTAAIFYCDAAREIEDALGVDGLAEGYQLTVALADGQQEDAELRIPASLKAAAEATTPRAGELRAAATRTEGAS